MVETCGIVWVLGGMNDRHLPQNKTEKGQEGFLHRGKNKYWSWVVGPIPPFRSRRKKEREERGLLDWDQENIIFTSFAKAQAESPRT